MSYAWTEFLILAKALYSDPESPGPTEAALRSAASRAYYAAFHCALDFACEEGFEPTYSGDDHRSVQRHFRNCEPPDQTRKKLATELDRLHGHRREADYFNTLRRRPRSLAELAIGMAERVFRYLDSLAGVSGVQP